MSQPYQKLEEAWRREHANPQLQHISDTLLHELKEYVDTFNKTQTDPDTLTGKITQTERTYANQMLRELTETRLNKIITSETNGQPIDAQAMTPEEQQLHSNLRQLLSSYRQGAEIPKPRTTPKPELKPAPAKPSPPPPTPKPSETEFITVRFIQPLPAIMGIDMKAYGPFQPEELASIPRQNAENLIKRGIAKLVDVNV